MEEREELEHIPWSELRAEQPDGRRRIVMLAAAVVAAIGLGAVIARVVTTPAGAVAGSGVVTTGSDPTDGTVAAPGDTSEEVIAGDLGDTMGDVEDGDAALYSEADLLAVPLSGPVMAAIARGERFLYDYFTSDRQAAGSHDVRASMAEHVHLPPMPQDQAGGISYVEWASAFAVRAIGDDLFEVDFLFVVLAAGDDGQLYRMPPRAVTVRIAASADGGAVIADLPTPVVVPEAPIIESTTHRRVADVPTAVVGAVAERIPGWAADPRILTAEYTGESWRVVITAVDEVGIRWPLMVTVPGPPPD